MTLNLTLARTLLPSPNRVPNPDTNPNPNPNQAGLKMLLYPVTVDAIPSPTSPATSPATSPVLSPVRVATTAAATATTATDADAAADGTDADPPEVRRRKSKDAPPPDSTAVRCLRCCGVRLLWGGNSRPLSNPHPHPDRDPSPHPHPHSSLNPSLTRTLALTLALTLIRRHRPLSGRARCGGRRRTARHATAGRRGGRRPLNPVPQLQPQPQH